MKTKDILKNIIKNRKTADRNNHIYPPDVAIQQEKLLKKLKKKGEQND